MELNPLSYFQLQPMLDKLVLTSDRRSDIYATSENCEFWDWDCCVVPLPVGAARSQVDHRERREFLQYGITKLTTERSLIQGKRIIQSYHQLIASQTLPSAGRSTQKDTYYNMFCMSLLEISSSVRIEIGRYTKQREGFVSFGALLFQEQI